MPVQTLIETVWDGHGRGRSSLQRLIHDLRHLLGDRQVRTVKGGYLLDVPAEAIDAARFRQLIGQAQGAHGRGDQPTAWKLYTEALSLWRGEALAELTATDLVAERARLEAGRLAAIEERALVGLALGRHSELAAELHALTTAHPSNERMWALRLAALYGANRRPDALETSHAAQAAGLDRPDGLLGRVQQAITARADPQQVHTLLLEGLGHAPPARQPAAPRQPDQRKLVTALVVGVTTTDDGLHDPEDARARTTAAIAHMTQRIQHYGGVVQATDLGLLLATFGADRSHEDDPERAVRAALELVDPGGSGHAGLAARGGVATGEVLVTYAHGGPEVLGDVIQNAAALRQAAEPGAVLVSAPTRQATSRSVDYAPVRPADAAAASGTRVWQAVAPRSRTGAQAPQTPEAPLTERRWELGVLTDVLTQFLRQRRPQALTLVSEPGLGKSRLVAELARRVDEAVDLVTWRVGHARAYGQGALEALAEVVAAEAGILRGDDPAVAQHKLAQAVAEVGLEAGTGVVEALASLLGIGDATESPGRSGQLETLHAAWAEFFAAMADRRPLVLVLEDLHWADDALLGFTSQLLERIEGAPLLLVCTYRPELLERLPGWSAGQRDAITISLPPLSREGTATLLDTLLRAADGDSIRGLGLPEPTREALLDAAGGNPLFIEEFVHMLAGQDADTVPAEQPLTMPTSVQQVIAARVDTLPPGDKRLLQDAAVVGETCLLGQLAAVARAGRDEVAEGLRRLERRDFLRRLRAASVAGETEYAFRHTLIRDVAYNQLLREERAAKHQRAAAWIESLGADAGERTELLAHHYGRALALASAAGQPTGQLTDQARRVARLRGGRAMEVGSFAAAADAYQAALKLCPADDPHYPELLLEVGRAQVFHAHAGQETLQQARKAALETGRTDLLGEIDLLIATSSQGRRFWPLFPSSDEATSQLLRDSDQVLRLVLADRLEEAITAATELITLARRLGHPGHEGSGMHLRGQARVHAGDLGGLEDMRAGQELMDADESQYRGIARYAHARALWWYGDLERCHAAVADGLAFGGGVAAHWFDGIQTALDHAAGRPEQGLATAGRALGGKPPAVRVRAECLLYRGSIHLARGDPHAALADAHAAANVVHEEDTRYRQAAAALAGRCLLASGRREDAAGRLQDLLAIQRARPAQACVTPDEAALMLDLDVPADALPERLPPTRWHDAARALVNRDVQRAAELLDSIGARVDAAAARAR